jgi:hypothetical protein
LNLKKKNNKISFQGDPLVSLWTTKDLKRNLFYVFDFDRENRFREFIMKVKWISESEVALGLNNGTIEIYRISESHPVTAPQITRKLKHDVSYLLNFLG